MWDKFLLLTSSAAFAIAALRIAFLSVKVRKRRKEVCEDSAAGRIIFQEAADDISIRHEIVRSALVILAFWVFPVSIISLWFCSYAGIVSKVLSAVSVVAAYFVLLGRVDRKYFR